MRLPARLRRDEGVILAVVLVFVALFATFAAVLAGLAVTSVRETNGTARQGVATYTAEGAVNLAIRRAMSSFQSNAAAIVTGATWACPGGTVSATTAASATATCTVTGTSVVGDGDPKPVDAIRTLGGPITISRKGALTVGGNVSSGGKIWVHPRASLIVDGTARAVVGACARVTASLGVTCPATPGPTDPVYPPALPSAPTTVASVPTTCGRIVTFEAPAGGLLFNDASALNKLTDGRTPSCAGTTIWFKPGVYYFHFSVGQQREWTIADPKVSVVAGVAKGGWDTDPTLAPSFPGGCDPSRTSGSPGSQFVFGGASRLNVNRGRLEICRVRSDAQSLAIYGPRSDGAGYLHQTGTILKLGVRGQLAVQGTVYAPLGAVDLDTQRQVTSVVSRGIIAKSVKLRATPFAGKSVLTPPALVDADVMVTTRIVGMVEGRSRIDAIVTFSRTKIGSTFRYSTSVARWEVLR